MRQISANLSTEAAAIYDGWAKKGKSGRSKGDRISHAIVFYHEHGPVNNDGLHARMRTMEKNVLALQDRLTEKFVEVEKLSKLLAAQAKK